MALFDTYNPQSAPSGVPSTPSLGSQLSAVSTIKNPKKTPQKKAQLAASAGNPKIQPPDLSQKANIPAGQPGSPWTPTPGSTSGQTPAGSGTPPLMAQLSGLRQQITGLAAPSAAETSTVSDITNLDQQFAAAKTSLQGTPQLMSNYIGQSGALADQYNTTSGNLLKKLGLLQSMRRGQAQDLQTAYQDVGGEVANEQNAASFALQNRIDKPFYKIGGTVYRTSDSTAFPDQASATAAGVTDANVEDISKNATLLAAIDPKSWIKMTDANGNPNGMLFNTVTGETVSADQLQGGGGGGAGGGAGSAASVNNVSGLKQNGQFIPFNSPQDSFNATVQDWQNKINGQTGTGLTGNSTLQDAVNTWINGSPAQAQGQGYTAQDVANYLAQQGVPGVTPQTPISQIGAQNIATAVAHFETGYDASTGQFAGGQGGQNTILSQVQSGQLPAISGNKNLNLQGVNPNNIIDSQALQLVTGQAAPSQLSKRAAQYGSILKKAQQIDPSFSAENAEANFQAKRSYTSYINSPAYQNTIKYLDSVMPNLDTLVTLSNSIDRTQFPLINRAQLAAMLQSGDVSAAQYAVATLEVGDQIAKILQGGGTGSGSSDAKLQQAQEILNGSFTVDQITGIAQELKGLLATRKEALLSNTMLSIQGNLNAADAQGAAADTAAAGVDYTSQLDALMNQ